MYAIGHCKVVVKHGCDTGEAAPRERPIANTGTAVSCVHCLLALMGAGDRETRLCSRPDGSAVNGRRARLQGRIPQSHSSGAANRGD